MAKLTDKNSFSGSLQSNDLIHVVDVNDLSQSPAGSSYKLSLAQLIAFLGNGSQNLQQVLTNGNSTGGLGIKSPDNTVSFLIHNAEIHSIVTNGIAGGEFISNLYNNSLSYSDGTVSGQITQNNASNRFYHDISNILQSPLNQVSQNATTALGIVTLQQLQAYALTSGSTAGGDLSGTYPNPAVLNSAVLAKLLTGLNITGSSLASTDSLLTAFGKLQNQLNGVLGGAIYHGTYNATTNIPTLVDGTGTQGWYYVVATAGLYNFGSGNIDLNIGDWIIYNGTIWQKVDNTDAVSSVNGFIGAVNLTSANITEVTNLYFTTARALATALTGYVSGAGTISATDSILQAIQKLNGNIGAIVSGVSSVNALTGAVTLTTANVADSTNKRYQTDSQQTNNDATSSIQTQLNAKEATSNKDASNGYVGLTLFKINFKNALNTFTSFFTNANTASRTYTFKDADGTVAFTSDITGTNSGTNTGDNAVNTNYANDYRLANFVAGTNYLAPNGSASALTGFPTLNQNTTGSASTITGAITESQVTNLVSDLAGKQPTGTYASGTGSASGVNTGNETLASIATINHSATSKPILVDADELTGQDSASTFSLIRTTLLNVFTYIQKKFETKTLVGDVAYSILASDNVIMTSVALTLPRIWTLPSASSVNAGNEKIVDDSIGAITTTNTITIGVQTGQYLNNVLNGTEVMTSAFAHRRLISDGVNNWTFDAGIVRLGATQTITNKTVKKRILVVTQSATPSTNIDNADIVQITALAQAITSMTTNLTGTPYDGQMIMWQFTDNGTARAIAWGASFASTTNRTLPTTTIASTMLRVIMQYNSVTSKHECQFVN